MTQGNITVEPPNTPFGSKEGWSLQVLALRRADHYKFFSGVGGVIVSFVMFSKSSPWLLLLHESKLFILVVFMLVFRLVWLVETVLSLSWPQDSDRLCPFLSFFFFPFPIEGNLMNDLQLEVEVWDLSSTLLVISGLMGRGGWGSRFRTDPVRPHDLLRLWPFFLGLGLGVLEPTLEGWGVFSSWEMFKFSIWKFVWKLLSGKTHSKHASCSDFVFMQFTIRFIFSHSFTICFSLRVYMPPEMASLTKWSILNIFIWNSFYVQNWDILLLPYEIKVKTVFENTTQLTSLNLSIL